MLVPLILLCSACQRDVKTPFPEGLEPLEDMAVDPPAGADFPETTTNVVGETDDYVWAHVRGYLHADLTDVWELARTDGEAMADRRGLDDIATEYGVEEELGLSYVNTVTVNDIITLVWDNTHRGDLAAGDAAEPERYAIRFQKTDGSSLIDLLEGSLVLEHVEDGITEFQFIEHLKAPQTSPDDPLAYGEDLHETLAVMLAGDPMPDWTEQ